MAESLPSNLKRRAARSLAYLRREAEAVTPDEARRGRRPDWPDQPWGIGQDGSIAGIVYHVCAWKQLSLPMFGPGGVPGARAAFDAGAAPDADDWPGLLRWLEDVGARWNAALAELEDARFDEQREWEGHRLTLAAFVEEMVQHDIQHAAQIEYLRQLYAIAPA